MNEEFDNDEEGSEDIPVAECESGFSILESDFKNITSKLQSNDELAEFVDAYTRLYGTFYETYQNSQDLVEKITVLEEQIQIYNEEISEHQKNYEQDQDTIEELEKELSRSKLLTDKAHTREQQGQEVIENMRLQILKLNTELELRSKVAAEGEDDGGANKTKEAFEREKQRMIDEITVLKQKLTNALSYSEELEHKNSAADLKANELNNLIEQQASEASKKQRQIEKLETDIVQLNKEIEDLQLKLVEANEEIESNRKQISLLELQLRDQRAATEKATKYGEMLQLKLEKCQMEFDICTMELNELREKHTDLIKSCRLKAEECNQLRNELLKLTKCKENLEKKIISLERAKHNLEQDKEKMRTHAHLMEREIMISKKQTESDKKAIDTLIKEKEVLNKNLLQVQGTVEGHMRLINLQEQHKRKLELEINTLNTEIRLLKKNMVKLEKEKNKALGEALDLTQQVEDAMDELNMKQKDLYDLKKMIVELENKLRQQQNLFEAVRAERNSLQKQVQEVSSELAELKSKLKISIHQGQQFKEDIASKEALLVQEENMLKKLNKEKENLKIEVQQHLTHISKLKREIAELVQNEKTLTKCIADNEVTIKRQIKQFEQIMIDRDVIGAQLVRRNDEIGLLSEKMHILEITLMRGEQQYDQRIQDIKLLKLEIRRLRVEKNYLSKSIGNMTDLKTEVFTLERELAQEKLKCRALEEELQHPMNIHRWRKLEGSDPHVVDLLKKIQILQKRLLNQTSEAIEREKQLKEAEKLYLGLRQMLAKQPSPEIKNELIKTQKALNMRGTKLKCLVSELNMYETQALEFRMDVDRVTKELKETKKKYFKQKKLCESHLSETKLPAILSEDKQNTTGRVAGGGYKMS